MQDLLYVALVLVFFAAATGLVKVCDSIIGPDDAAASPGTRGDAATPTSTTAAGAEVTA